MSGITKTAMAALLLANEGEARLLRHQIQKASSPKNCKDWAKAAQKPTTCFGCMGGGNEDYATATQAFCDKDMLYDEAATNCIAPVPVTDQTEDKCKKSCCVPGGKVMAQFKDKATGNKFCKDFTNNAAHTASVSPIATAIAEGDCSGESANTCSNCTKVPKTEAKWHDVAKSCCVAPAAQ